MEHKTKLEELVRSKNPTIKKESDMASIKNTIIENSYNNSKLPINDSDSKALTFKKDPNTINQISKIDKVTPTNNLFIKSIKETCIDFVFIEVLYNLFEKGKACSIEAQDDFLNFCQEEGRKRNTYLKNFNIADYIKLKKLIDNSDFEKENLAWEIFESYPFVGQLCQKALDSSDFYAIFRVRFFLNFFIKVLQENTLKKDSTILNKKDNISFQSKKVIYSYNEFFDNYRANELLEAKGKMFLAKNFINCFSKDFLANIFQESDKEVNLNSNKTIDENKYICSYLLSNVNGNNNINYGSVNKKENDKIFKSHNNQDYNSSNNDIENDGVKFLDDSQSMPNSTKNVNLDLNITQNDFQRVFCIKSSKSNIDSAAGGKNSLNKINNNNNLKANLKYLIRNNVFMRITDIITKFYIKNTDNSTILNKYTPSNLPEETKYPPRNLLFKNEKDSNQLDNENNSKIEYYEIVCEFQKYDDLPSDYKLTLEKLKRKLSHIINLEYDNDYLYLFDILFCLDMHEKAIELIEDIISKNPTSVESEIHSIEDKKFFLAQNLYYLGEAYAKTNQIEKALKIHEESLQIKKEILREDHPEYVLSLNNLSSLYFGQENYEQALALYLECMEIEEKYLTDKTNPNLGITYNNIATVYNKLNKFEEALDFYLKNLENEKNNYGENSLECAATLNNIGIVYDNMGDFRMALGYYKNALRIREELSEEDDVELGNCYNNLAVALDNEGKIQDAVQYYQKSLKILLQHCDENHPDVQTVVHNIDVLNKRIEN